MAAVSVAADLRQTGVVPTRASDDVDALCPETDPDSFSGAPLMSVAWNFQHLDAALPAPPMSGRRGQPTPDAERGERFAEGTTHDERPVT
jgi:hypothetical protein